MTAEPVHRPEEEKREQKLVRDVLAVLDLRQYRVRERAPRKTTLGDLRNNTHKYK